MKTAKEYANQAARFAYLAGANQALDADIVRAAYDGERTECMTWEWMPYYFAQDAARAARARDVEWASMAARQAAFAAASLARASK